LTHHAIQPMPANMPATTRTALTIAIRRQVLPISVAGSHYPRIRHSLRQVSNRVSNPAGDVGLARGKGSG